MSNIMEGRHSCNFGLGCRHIDCFDGIPVSVMKCQLLMDAISLSQLVHMVFDLLWHGEHCPLVVIDFLPCSQVNKFESALDVSGGT